MYRLPAQRALRKLLTVIPVAQTQVHAEMALTVSSLDCYEQGFDINVYLWRDAPDGLTPSFSVFALFDGKEPGAGGDAGRKVVGDHQLDSPHWYFRYWHHPSPDASVREVQLVVPVIHLAEPRPFDTIRLVRDVPGPWRFTAALAWGRDATRTEVTGEPPPVLDQAWAEPAHVRQRRAERQAETLSRYGPLYDAVLDAVYRYDPWAIGWRVDVPFGAEVYKAEADAIVPQLPDARAPEDVQRIVYSVLGDYHGDRLMGGEECYTEIAEEIWATLHT